MKGYALLVLALFGHRTSVFSRELFLLVMHIELVIGRALSYQSHPSLHQAVWIFKLGRRSLFLTFELLQIFSPGVKLSTYSRLLCCAFNSI